MSEGVEGVEVCGESHEHGTYLPGVEPEGDGSKV